MVEYVERMYIEGAWVLTMDFEALRKKAEEGGVTARAQATEAGEDLTTASICVLRGAATVGVRRRRRDDVVQGCRALLVAQVLSDRVSGVGNHQVPPGHSSQQLMSACHAPERALSQRKELRAAVLARYVVAIAADAIQGDSRDGRDCKYFFEFLGSRVAGSRRIIY